MMKQVDLENDTIKVGLLSINHIFDATDSTWADVSANEVSGTNYSAGGNTITGKAVTVGNTTKWNATDTTFTNVTLTAYHAVIYDTTNSDSLICSFGFGQAYSPIADSLILQWDNVNNAILGATE